MANPQQNLGNIVTNVVNMMLIDSHGIVQAEVASRSETTIYDYGPPDTKMSKWEEKIINSIWLDQVDRCRDGLSPINEFPLSADEENSAPSVGTAPTVGSVPSVGTAPSVGSVPDDGAIRFLCTMLVTSMKISVPVIAVDYGIGLVRKKPSLTSRLWNKVFHKKHVLAPKHEEKIYQCFVAEPEPPTNPPHF